VRLWTGALSVPAALRRKSGGQRSGLSVPNAVRTDSRGARYGKTH